MVGSFICLSWPYCAGQAYSHLFTHGLRVLGPLRSDGSCECSHHFAGCQCSPPHLGGEIDYSPLRWCILTGTDCRAYAERYRVNSSDAQLLLTRRPYRRPLSCYTSVCLQYWILFSSQVRQSGRSCTILYALPQLISLHVFEDDTVA